MATTNTGETRDRRWNLRVEDAEDELVRAASEVSETKFSSFVRVAAVAEARRVLADRTQFALDQSGWDEFMKLLDRPARVPGGLRELFAKPSAFSE